MSQANQFPHPPYRNKGRSIHTDRNELFYRQLKSGMPLHDALKNLIGGLVNEPLTFSDIVRYFPTLEQFKSNLNSVEGEFSSLVNDDIISDEKKNMIFHEFDELMTSLR